MDDDATITYTVDLLDAQAQVRIESVGTGVAQYCFDFFTANALIYRTVRRLPAPGQFVLNLAVLPLPTAWKGHLCIRCDHPFLLPLG